MTAVVESSVGARSRTVADVLESGVGAGVVMSVVSGGGPASGWLVVGEPVGGAERQCAVVGVAQGAVLAAGPVSEVTVVGDPIPMADPMPAWALVVAGAIWETQRVQRELELARAAVRANETRLERIVDAAHEYAEDNSLCDRFDIFMISQGLRPRTRNYICEVDVTVRVRIPASGHSAEGAAETISESAAVAAVGALRPDVLADAVHDFDVVDVEED